MRPWLLRPPLLWRGRPSDFSGSDRVISTKSATLEPRRLGVVGLYLRMPIFFVHPLFLYLPYQSWMTPRNQRFLARCQAWPPKISIRSPSARLTIARLVLL